MTLIRSFFGLCNRAATQFSLKASPTSQIETLLSFDGCWALLPLIIAVCMAKNWPGTAIMFMISAESGLLSLGLVQGNIVTSAFLSFIFTLMHFHFYPIFVRYFRRNLLIPEEEVEMERLDQFRADRMEAVQENPPSFIMHIILAVGRFFNVWPRT